MNESPTQASSLKLNELRREIGCAGTRGTGPLLVILAGLHGNEPAGVLATERFFKHLSQTDLELAGQVVGFTCNLSALRVGKRYVDVDLNRVWTQEHIDSVKSGTHNASHAELTELAELYPLLDEAFLNGLSGASDVRIIDLHTASGGGDPFVLSARTGNHRAFSEQFPIPHVVGLNEKIGGTALSHFSSLGFTCIGFEGGQHQDPRSVDVLENSIWLALEVCGVVSGMTPAISARRRLEARGRELPRYLSVFYRHGIDADSGFEMKPGFNGMQWVEKGTVLGKDTEGPVVAPESGYLVLPLYQGIGGDGFFLAEEIQ